MQHSTRRVSASTHSLHATDRSEARIYLYFLFLILFLVYIGLCSGLTPDQHSGITPGWVQGATCTRGATWVDCLQGNCAPCCTVANSGNLGPSAWSESFPHLEAPVPQEACCDSYLHSTPQPTLLCVLYTSQDFLEVPQGDTMCVLKTCQNPLSNLSQVWARTSSFQPGPCFSRRKETSRSLLWFYRTQL